jgi:hypothetical protein
MVGVLQKTPCYLGLIESGKRYFTTIVRVVAHVSVKYDDFLLQPDLPHNIPASMLTEHRWMKKEKRWHPTRRMFENAQGYTFLTCFDEVHTCTVGDIESASLFFPENWLPGTVNVIPYKTTVTDKHPVALLRWWFNAE